MFTILLHLYITLLLIKRITHIYNIKQICSGRYLFMPEINSNIIRHIVLYWLGLNYETCETNGAKIMP